MIDPTSEFKFKAAIFTNAVEADHDIDVFLKTCDAGTDAVAHLMNDAPAEAGEESNSSGKNKDKD